MRIVHVVTLVSADGAYGGPIAVAKAQCEELADSGHAVALFAGWDGRAELAIPGVNVRLFRTRKVVPGRGFAGLVAPGLSRALAAEPVPFDVAHIHLARDLVTIPAARVLSRKNIPLVLQTHGMVRRVPGVKASIFDRLLTRPTLRAASAQLVLTDDEERDAPSVAKSSVNLIRVRNGVRPAVERARWATGTPEVIFCARLHERKRPTAFVRMADELLRRGVRASFTIAGPDEGELDAVDDLVRALGISDAVRYAGALLPSNVLATMAKAQVYVLPSINEPYPMSILEALSIGLPVVLTESTGISNDLMTSSAARVTDGSVKGLADGVEQLLASSDVWTDASAAALELATTRYETKSLGTQLTEVYVAATGRDY